MHPNFTLSKADPIQSFVSDLDKRVFAIYGLPEEVIAVLFAYYSRSRDDLRTNLRRLLSEDCLAAIGCDRPALTFSQKKASEFHEKWVVGFGHSSVAEHANVHLAVENVSILASKAIESLRLGSFTEKSTRYVFFDTDSFTDLPELPEDLRKTYTQSCSQLFETYRKLYPQVQLAIRNCNALFPKMQTGPSEAAVRSQTLDLLRGLLPASTKTNLGISVNARALTYLLNDLYASPLQEVRQIATEIHCEASKIVPTLLRHVNTAPRHPSIQRSIDKQSPSDSVKLLNYDGNALERVFLALTYDSGRSADSILTDTASEAGYAMMESTVRTAALDRDTHDPVPRAFEATSFTIELELDYGAYRDLQRHRMLSPFNQLLTCHLGYTIPDNLTSFGLQDLQEEYCSALNKASETWDRLYKRHPFEAQYAVPLAYRVRVIWTVNLRELFHIIELRSASTGHASYRKVAMELHRCLCKVFPWLRGLMRVDNSIEYAPKPEKSTREIALELIRLANTSGQRAIAKIAGSPMVADPGDSPERAIERWERIRDRTRTKG